MKTKTYKHTRSDGKTVRVSVPENPTPDELLADAIRERLSPHAVASIASHLQGAKTNNINVDREVRWFADELCRLLGGYDQQAKLAADLSL